MYLYFYQLLFFVQLKKIVHSERKFENDVIGF